MSQQPKKQEDKKTNKTSSARKVTKQAVKETQKSDKPIGNTQLETEKKSIGNFIREDKNQTKIGNIISAGMFVITLVLAIYTGLLFYETQKATNTSTNAVDIANRSLKHQITKDSTDSVSDAKKLGRDNDFVKKQSVGIDAQIASFREQQKQFEVTNRPVLTITHLANNDFKIGLKPYISMHVLNSGKLPCQIIGGFIRQETSVDPNFKPSYNHKNTDALVNQYVSPGFYSEQGVRFGETVTEEVFNEYTKTKNKFVYVYGLIKYKAIDTDKTYSTKFNVRMSEFPSPAIVVMSYESK